MHEKANNLGFQPGLTQTGLCSHRNWLEAPYFGFKKKRNCTICVAKTQALISCAVTAQLICGFVFAYAKIRFSHDAANLIVFWQTFRENNLDLFAMVNVHVHVSRKNYNGQRFF